MATLLQMRNSLLFLLIEISSSACFSSSSGHSLEIIQPVVEISLLDYSDVIGISHIWHATSAVAGCV